MQKRTGTNSQKQKNRGDILKLLATAQANTRVSLAKKSGLTKMTVSNIVEEYLSDHILAEGQEKKQHTRGKNPVSLMVSQQAPKVIGLLINRDSCTSVLCDLKLNRLYSEQMVFSYESREEFRERLFRLVDHILAREPNILGIGVASLGPLNVKEGTLLNPPRFYGIKDVAICAELEQQYHLPVFLDHQYNSAARAEKLFGVGQAVRSFIFVGITDGIGAGIYIENQLLQGGGLGCELGHMSVDPQGISCECGSRGCIEKYAGTDVIRQHVEALRGEKLSFDECCRRSAGQADIDSIFGNAINQLAVCLTSVVNLLNPELILIGHEGVLLPDKYLQYLEQYINDHKLSGDYQHITIKKATFGSETQLLGAACNVLDQLFVGELSI